MTRLACSSRVVPLLAMAATLGCHDLTNFSTSAGTVYRGAITSASFVRAGLGSSVEMCLDLDVSRLQSNPGSISTNDGLFHETPLRQIPQVWQDPLSTFNFGEGRVQNMLYVAEASATKASPKGDAFVVVSLMDGGGVEVRILRGAPSSTGGTAPGDPTNLFGVFSLTLEHGACPF